LNNIPLRGKFFFLEIGHIGSFKKIENLNIPH
jgi:hypothetical protein